MVWGAPKTLVKPFAFNASVKVKSKILPRYSNRKEESADP